MRREARGNRRAGRESHEKEPIPTRDPSPGNPRPREAASSNQPSLWAGTRSNYNNCPPSRRIIAEGRSRPRGDVPPRGSGPAEYDIGQVLATRDVMKKWISAAIIF